MREQDLIRIWGKTDDHDESIFHPLLFHMLDVANVAHAIWQDCLGHAGRGRIARALGATDEGAGMAVALLAGLHDLGKACPEFQRKAPGLVPPLHSAGLKTAGVSTGKPHGMVSAREVQRILAHSIFGWQASGSTARVLARITGAHHGSFPRSIDLRDLVEGSPTLGDAAWTEVRDQLAITLARNFDLRRPGCAPTSTGELTEPGMVPFLAGLISVADWIGSSKHFSLECATPLSVYEPISRRRAKEALRRLGWLPTVRPAPMAPFNEIFPFPPNALQQAVVDATAAGSGPYLLVVEGPMGKGKTEAALYAADCSLCSHGARGFYLALPTQATSNAMHRRVRQYLRKRGHSGLLNLQLVHGNALLVETPETSPIYSEDATGEGRVAAQSWFTGRKRPLLAPFGVGTIDQALLSTLQTRHWFVRLFGLAHKTVIFDEVHAYDTYTTTLLERLLAWLAQVDCNVILLSATLPTARKRALIEKFRGSSAALPHGAYPRVTRVDNRRTDVRSIEVESSWRTPVRLDFAGTEPDSLAALLRKELAEGGCAAVICNTVARAQGMYERLRDLLAGCQCHLFHARYPFRWRREREKQVLRMFGKGGRRPERAVLVATQVVEQSLDLDFDWMATDMAPIDLLLQRAGRLYRHSETRRPARLQSLPPCLTILCDGARKGPPPAFGDSAKVYERYVLLCSWLAIRHRRRINLPRDIDRLVQRVYAEPPRVGIPDVMWQEALADTRSKMEERILDEERAARKVLICEPDDPEELVEAFNAQLSEDEDPSTHSTLRAATRLGDSLQVVCLNETADGLFLPYNGTRKVELDAPPDLAMTRRLLDAALPISEAGGGGVYYELLCGDPLPGWRKNPHLRFHRILRFRDGHARMRAATLSLDGEAGLKINWHKRKQENP